MGIPAHDGRRTAIPFCMTWVIWVLVGVAALAGELLSLGLFLGSFGLAALITAGVAQVASPVVQVAVFCILSLVLLLLVRPAVLPLLPVRSGPEMEPRVGPIGQIGTVTRRVDEHRGQIRVGMGEFWTARLIEPLPPADVGQDVEVIEVSGLTALVRPVVQKPGALAAGDRDRHGLSPRELEVLRLVALGRSNDEIARELVLSPRTVHHHVSHILDKLNADSRVDATRIAMREGLIPPD